MTERVVPHAPVWAPAQLPINEEGDREPGFRCVYPLEDNSGLCAASTFEVDVLQDPAEHSCVVDEPELPSE